MNTTITHENGLAGFTGNYDGTGKEHAVRAGTVDQPFGVGAGLYGTSLCGRSVHVSGTFDALRDDVCRACAKAVLIELWSSDAYGDDPDGATELWRMGFRPVSVEPGEPGIEPGQFVAYRATDIFFGDPTGPTMTAGVLAVRPLVSEWCDDTIEWTVEHTAGETSIEDGDELWVRPAEQPPTDRVVCANTWPA